MNQQQQPLHPQQLQQHQSTAPASPNLSVTSTQFDSSSPHTVVSTAAAAAATHTSNKIAQILMQKQIQMLQQQQQQQSHANSKSFEGLTQPSHVSQRFSPSNDDEDSNLSEA